MTQSEAIKAIKGENPMFDNVLPLSSDTTDPTDGIFGLILEEIANEPISDVFSILLQLGWR